MMDNSFKIGFDAAEILAIWREVNSRLRQAEIDRLLAVGIPRLALDRDPSPFDGFSLTAAQVEFLDDGFEFTAYVRDPQRPRRALIIPARNIDGEIGVRPSRRTMFPEPQTFLDKMRLFVHFGSHGFDQRPQPVIRSLGSGFIRHRQTPEK